MTHRRGGRKSGGAADNMLHAAKALGFDSRPASDDEAGGAGDAADEHPFGPTTRRQWSEFIAKPRPSTSKPKNNKENDDDVSVCGPVATDSKTF